MPKFSGYVLKTQLKTKSMARIRTIKPDFFKNVDLSDLKYEVRLLFIGLWVLSDREGRLEDIAKKIKADIFPYDNMNVEKGLKELADKKFIVRYKAQVIGIETPVIQVVNFLKHQRPHVKEQPSYYPAPTKVVATHNLGDGLHVGKGREGKGNEIGMDNGDGNGGLPTTPPETVIPKAEKKEPPPFAAPPPPNPPTGFLWVADCLKKYFEEEYYSISREHVAMSRHCDLAILKDWAGAFNRKLISTGEPAKAMDDWAKHFGNWMKFQDMSNNPLKLFTEYEQQGTSNNAANGTGGSQSAFDKIDRMHGKVQ